MIRPVPVLLAALALAIIILVHRRIKSVEADDASNLKG